MKAWVWTLPVIAALVCMASWASADDVPLARATVIHQAPNANPTAAYRWLVLASSQHLAPEDAARIADARDDLAKHLTAQQINAALAEARSFVPKPE